MTDLLAAPVTAQAVGALRLFAAWAETGRPAGLREHLARLGPLPVPRHDDAPGRERLVALVERSGLRGRGGAGFPTARKIATVVAARGRPLVVANGCEGDPTSVKDRALLAVAPHLVLDGIAAAAHAVGAREAVLCVHAGDPLAGWLHAAITERRDGEVAVELVEVPHGYVASEASALVNFLGTGDARPTSGPPAAVRGVRGRPTLVDNVETLAQLALVVRFGDTWFRRAGTDGSPGTALLTVGGAVTEPGVYEIDMGLPVAGALALAGGGTDALAAVLVGGLGGRWLPLPDAGGLGLAHGDRSALGVASLVALPAGTCGLAETARVLRFLAAESAGQCGPCVFGLPAVAADLTELVEDGDGAALELLWRRLGLLPGRGACAHPDGAVRIAASALTVFAEDAEAHARGAPCAGGHDEPWVPLPDERPVTADVHTPANAPS